MTYTPTQNIPGPADREREDLWLEEQYWGHRLWDQQSPWLIFLEFLGAAQSAHQQGQLFSLDHSLYPSAYSAHSRIYLRNILFRNEQLLFQTAQHVGDDGAAWTTWLDYMAENASGLDAGQRDFSYLRPRFDSFQDFAALIRALRSCIVESDTNKRWSSRFLFPFGPDAFYEDLDIKAKGTSRDYINFGRSGELLYLMLSRSARRTELAELFPGRVLENTNKWNRLVARLQPDIQQNAARRGVDAFLPYDSHPVFDLIAEDWIALLQLKLPGFDIVPYLVSSGAFGLLLYHLHTSSQVCSETRLPPIICEVVGPKKTLVREMSIESYDENAGKSVEAMETLIAKALDDPQWNLQGPPIEMLTRRRDVLTRLFRWNDRKDGVSITDPEELIRELRKEAKVRHQRHFGQVHRTFGRGVGLVSKRGTNRLRYAPTDGFLKCLIYSNVPRRTEFGELLQHLYQRYGLVFGDRAAEQACDDREIDKKPFQANALRLEQRLSSLGLLKRLSDACAYVENPYAP